MRILDFAYALPGKRVTNQDVIDEIILRSRKHLSQKDLEILESKIRKFFRLSGTKIRYHRKNSEKAFEFAVTAGREVLRKAVVKPRDVDLLIYSGVGRGWITPATASLFQSELGLRRATSFGVLDACASWIRSLSIAKTFLDGADYKLVMLLNCEFCFKEYCEANLEISSIAELACVFSGFTIGEAATATLLSGSGSSRDFHFSFRTWGDKHELCKIVLPNEASFSTRMATPLKPMSFYTLPAELLSFTAEKLVEHFKETRILANQNYDLVVGHAVSKSLTTSVAKLMGLDRESVFETHPRFGNTVSATLPLALAVAEEEGRLRRGMRVLLVMGSAGVSTGLGSFVY